MEPLKGNDTRMVPWFIAPTICIAHRVALRDKVRWFVQCNLGNSGGDVSCPNVTASDCSRMCGEVHLIFCRTSTRYFSFYKFHIFNPAEKVVKLIYKSENIPSAFLFFTLLLLSIDEVIIYFCLYSHS